MKKGDDHMPFISLFKRKAVEKKKDTDGDHNRENSEKKNKEQQSRNFLKDAEGLFPHEILLKSDLSRVFSP